MFIDNINYLRQNHRHIRDLLQQYESRAFENNIDIIETKSGLPTIQVMRDNQPQFIHSKYDPKKEAEKFIDQFDQEINEYEHVLFYGVGLGYHIEAFMSRFPQFTFSIYEPNLEIFYEYTKHRSINELPVHRLKEIYIETSREAGQQFLTRLTNSMQERILLVVLPSYERIYHDKFKAFIEDFKESMETKRFSFYTDTKFSARWTLNSLINFPKTISTPNILDGFESCFKDKPLIIVSAGPSLEEEYENLRYIKENKLAYIFAVGSANRALVAQNIMPDAVCTYDPQEHNYNVFASIIENGIDTIPMIFGTSVGFETLNWYQGPKLHMVTSQDTVGQYYLQNKDRTSINVIDDSPTIAAITFQLAAKLGCNPVLFAGQNLAFKNEQFYSKDVEYNKRNRPIEVEEKDRQHVLLVDDVYGNKVETTPSFNNMRDNIEWYVAQFPEIEAINTTKGGAAIAGTTFQPLEELIKERFNSPVVVEDWYKSCENNYDLAYTTERLTKMERSITEFRKLYKEIMSIFADMEKHTQSRNENKLSKSIVKFDKLMKKIVVNDCYVCYIQPVNRTQYQALSIRAANIRKQTNEMDKAKLIMESFYPYLERCKLTLEQIAGSLYKVHGEARHFIERDQYKFYPSDCGAFQYIGEWEKQKYTLGKTIDYPIKQHLANKKDALVRFRFTGTELKILGSKNKEGSSKIRITIDGKSENISVKTSSIDSSDVPNINQLLYTKGNLDNTEHLVEMKLLDDNLFLFTGVGISQAGRLYHVDEVTNIEQLEIGKRIRCHYKASYNKVGEFGGLGEERKGFIPPESSAFPDGDFYFIMVDEDDGGKKLIADRNVQHSISWKNIDSAIDGLFKKISVKNIIRLPTGGSNLMDIENDWIRYIVNSNLEWFSNVGISSWTATEIEGNPNRRVRRGKNDKIQYIYNEFTEINFFHSSIGFRPILLMDS
ncbi:MAG TPA: motility associated factor glycosyltransferase family protein [Bacillus bacterium]|nr:motility associated factor glycosyltransferase family protein [Bacillus sp. (in: firmicutes)]